MKKSMSLLGFLCSILALWPAAAAGDISPEPSYGQTLAPRKDTQVEMTEETVTIRFLREKALIDAVFMLKNAGAAAEHEVGFPDVVLPEESGGDGPPTGAHEYMLRDFKVKVDGKPVSTTYKHVKGTESPRLLREIEEQKKKIEAERDPELKKDLEVFMETLQYALKSWAYRGWVVWSMGFPANSACTVEVSYWLPYRPPYESSLLREGTIEYVLRTGAPWKGRIGKARVVAKLEEGLGQRNVKASDPPGFKWTGQEGVLELLDFEPDRDVTITLNRLADLDEAAKYYMSEADRRYTAEPDEAVWFLATAADALQAGGKHEECIAACRRIIAHEKAARAGDPQKQVKFVNKGWRDPYVPWEIRILACCRKIGDQGRVAQAAADAAAAIKSLLEMEEGSRPAIEEKELKALLADCEKASGGGGK